MQDQVDVGGGGRALTQIAPEDRTPAAVAGGADLDGTGTVTTRHLGMVTVGILLVIGPWTTLTYALRQWASRFVTPI